MTELEVAVSIMDYFNSAVGSLNGFELYMDGEDGFTICEASPLHSAESTCFVGRLDDNTLFVRWISINSNIQRCGHFKRFAQFIIQLCMTNHMELFFTSCINITRDVIRQTVCENYKCVLTEADMSEVVGSEATDMDISFVHVATEGLHSNLQVDGA